MIQAVYAILCDYGIYDRWRLRHSAIGVINHFSAGRFPAVLHFDVISQWMADEGEANGNFMIRVTPVSGSEGNGKVIAATLPEQMIFDPFTHTATNTAHFDIEIAAPGDYQLQFYFEDRLVHTLTFPVIPED
ncbi:MAG: hypothetical protein WHV66_00005 [Anaerolineales bacterium]